MGPAPGKRPRTSTRDYGELRVGLARWLAGRLGTEAPITDLALSELAVPAASGMSSETLVFDATWAEHGHRRRRGYVARLEPDPSALPVFPTYDLARQFRVMGLVGARTAVPVPEPLWYEADDGHLGSPFFVMARVEGEAPPDLMPYVFGSWLTEAAPDDQDRLQHATVKVLADLHNMEAGPGELAFLELDRPGATPLRRHVADLAAYYDWVGAGLRLPVVERAFAWLDDHWPAQETPPVVSWGDARIGNVLYRNFEPVAVLDWEMAAVGPAELDLGWLVFMHQFFQEIAEGAGLVGMPHFMRVDDVAGTYERLTGRPPRDLGFFQVYAALRHAVVMARVARRAVHFGEAAMPDDPDDLVFHRRQLERMLSA